MCMSLCVCLYMFVCTYVYMSVHLPVYVCMCLCVHVSVPVYVSVCPCLPVYVYVCPCIILWLCLAGAASSSNQLWRWPNAILDHSNSLPDVAEWKAAFWLARSALPVRLQVLTVYFSFTVEDCSSGLSMSSRPSTVVLVRRLPACLCLPTAPSPVIRFTVVCRSTCTQHVWWPVLCRCRAAGLELFAGWIATM